MWIRLPLSLLVLAMMGSIQMIAFSGQYMVGHSTSAVATEIQRSQRDRPRSRFEREPVGDPTPVFEKRHMQGA